MTKDQHHLVTIHVNIDITPFALATIVANAKEIFGKDKNGRYAVDTADFTAEIISKFLLEKDFDGYVKDKSNYTVRHQTGGKHGT